MTSNQKGRFHPKCRCSVCQKIYQWINSNHWTTGQKRDRLADNLITEIAKDWGFT